MLGTASYMSPEQARGQKVDGRSDLFSLGVILYELITGNKPFCGETWHHTIVAITDAEPPPIKRDVIGAPAALQEIISRALAKNRDQRYQTAGAMLAELKTLQGELASDARIQRIETERAQKTTTTSGRLTGGNALANLTTAEGLAGRATGAVTLFSWLKRHQITVTIGIIALALAAAYFFFGRGLMPSRPALTDKDTILVADFVNTTGDAVFDGTLKQGLVVQLEQSPYLNIFPEERARETLRLMERSTR